VAAAGRPQLGGRYHGQPGGQGQLDPVLGAFALQLATAGGRKVRHVVGDVDRGRVHRAGQPDHLGGRVAPAQDQVGAALAEGRAQVGEGFGQEAGAVRGRGDRRVDHEQWHHLPRPGAGLVQRRVVVQPEITGKDHDRGVHLR
jgi:hypothetical protein